MYSNFKEMPVVYDELKARVDRNIGRLTAPMYRPDAIYTADKAGWPADWEGRTILALVSQWKITGTEPAYLKEIIENLPSHLNEKGYIGKIQDLEAIDEQQISGHNWLLRGLLEYYIVTKENKIKLMIDKIIMNLYLPLTDKYKTYPLNREEREAVGEASGTVNGKIGSWMVSTDIGCAFMCMDGLSQYYEITKAGAVCNLLCQMVDVFETIDFIGNKVQTHATLSALRGIIRLYNVSKKQHYLEIVETIFKLYQENAMTDNYANFNWFGRPDTWTEPCAIVDSMIVAMELFKIGGNKHYLKLAQRIYYNAFCYAQRANGGFGIDKVVGPANKYLKPAGEGFAEAFWCCTMRGAEGLRYIAENLFLKKDDIVFLTFGFPASIETEDYKLEVNTKLPYDGKFNIRLTAKHYTAIAVRFYNGTTYTFHLDSGEKKTIAGEIVLHEDNKKSKFNEEGKKHFIENMLLSKSADDMEAKPKFLTDMLDIDEKDAEKENRVVVY